MRSTLESLSNCEDLESVVLRTWGIDLSKLTPLKNCKKLKELRIILANNNQSQILVS